MTKKTKASAMEAVENAEVGMRNVECGTEAVGTPEKDPGIYADGLYYAPEDWPGGIIWLPSDQLFSHPDNPRKDLGDLSELAESIKANGVLQNLTVVPFEGNYRMVIGHRRKAAGDLAGLTHFPCVISDMDYKTQLSTMLSENMQRSDLTVVEQAEAVQMMLDLGETVQVLARKTGLSVQTVKHRAQLARLDKEKLRQATGRNVRLEDLAKLEAIEDVKVRNELLEYMGSGNFDYKLLQAQRDQDARKNRQAWMDKLNSFAVFRKTKDYNTYNVKGYNHIKTVLLYEDPSTFLPIEPAGGHDEYIYVSDTEMSLRFEIHRKDKAETAKKSSTPYERMNARRSKLEKLGKDFKLLWMQYIKGMSKKEISGHMAALQGFLALCIRKEAGIYIVREDLKTWMGTVDQLDADEVSPEKMMVLMCFSFGPGKMTETDYNKCRIEHSPGEQAVSWFGLLDALGYEPGDEEKKWRDGSHELYYHPRGKKPGGGAEEPDPEEAEDGLG